MQDTFNFQIRKDTNKKRINIYFDRKKLCNSFGNFYFYSKLLHSMVPNADSEWIEARRSESYIIGWPPSITWNRIKEKEFETYLPQLYDKDKIKFYCSELKEAIHNLENLKFKISSENHVYNFEFSQISRQVNALCVLWDKEPHPRDHLEVITKVLRPNNWPLKHNDIPQRTYGDPSKTVDELRTQGFPRATDLEGQPDEKVSLNIYSDNYNGQTQQHYELLNREQNFKFKVGRSTVTTKWKSQLYKIHGYTCQVCHQKYESSYLSPDHRIPSIVEFDELNDENYLEKLQTLCVRCNQVKRESCKKCPYERNCRSCPWAFPEKFSVSSENLKNLLFISKVKNLTLNEMLEKLISNQELDKN